MQAGLFSEKCEVLITQHVVLAQVKNMLPVVFFAFPQENAFFRAVQKTQPLSIVFQGGKCRSEQNSLPAGKRAEMARQGKNAVDRQPSL
jgi:hypothetical protein